MTTYEEYLEYLRKNVGVLERLGDAFSGADERLDYAVQQLIAIQHTLTPETLAKIERLVQLYDELKEAGFIMPLTTQQITYRETLQPTQAVRLEDDVPLDGAITSVGFHFPPGCNGWVNVAVGHGYKQFMPISGWIALDSATPVIPTHEVCKREETVWARIENTDGLNPHTIQIMITMEGE